MSTQTLQPHCWRISLTNSVNQIAALIEAFEHSDPTTFKQVPLLKRLLASWKRGNLPDHDFLHGAKILAEKLIKPEIRSEALQVVRKVLEGNKALDVFKHSHLDRPDSKYDKDELALGRDVEGEHTTNKEAADIICKDHLDEDPRYYSKLKKVES